MSTIELLGFSDEEPTAEFTPEEWLELFSGDTLRASEARLGVSDVEMEHPVRRLKWSKVPVTTPLKSGVVDTSPWRAGEGVPELRKFIA
jgi:hypothetical protein